ncbi:MAG: four helix bundle protein [Salinibacter sp.]|uniref:four helix bundle protein n=1 Tax=Salinibacter sp. TaxID=2065818 RepID=UPI0035D4D80E
MRKERAREYEFAGVERGKSRDSLSKRPAGLMPVREFEELRASQQAYDAAPPIFRHSKEGPKETAHSLTDQIRRSPRSVSANIAERGGRGDTRITSSANSRALRQLRPGRGSSSGVTADASLKNRSSTSMAPALTFAEAS